jgi:hypothetical protein
MQHASWSAYSVLAALRYAVAARRGEQRLSGCGVQRRGRTQLLTPVAAAALRHRQRWLTSRPRPNDLRRTVSRDARRCPQCCCVLRQRGQLPQPACRRAFHGTAAAAAAPENKHT